MRQSSQPPIAYLNGHWVGTESLAVGFDDLGFRQAVTAVERMRTYNAKIFCLERHLRRWSVTQNELRIENLPDQSEVAQLLAELIRRNGEWVGEQGDVGITMVATPGEFRDSNPIQTPTFALHLNPLPHDRILNRQQAGQPVIITDVVQPPAESWSRQIKTRCRLHYYLADQQARRSNTAAPGILVDQAEILVDQAGILVDQDGTLTETSVCNLAMVLRGTILSPPRERILHGVTQSVVESLAQQAEIPWRYQPLDPKEFANAEEILMMGTDGGLWFANSVDGHRLSPPDPDGVLRKLQLAFDRFTRS